LNLLTKAEHSTGRKEGSRHSLYPHCLTTGLKQSNSYVGKEHRARERVRRETERVGRHTLTHTHGGEKESSPYRQATVGVREGVGI
jgi:hypothetical protein